MQDMIRLLIADDDAEALGPCIEALLSDEPNIGLELTTTPKQALVRVMNVKYDIILLDISFTKGGYEGLDLLSDVRNIQNSADIIMLSSIDSPEMKLRCLERGARNYIVKGLTGEIDDVIVGIRSAIAQKRYNHSSVSEGRILANKQRVLFASKQMDDVFSLAAKAKKAINHNVLITGSTGVGKDVVAHTLSRREEGAPFIAINCGAIPPSLVETELFGASKGSYTGSDRNRIGLFESAHGGDLFLDELATLPMQAQTALLRVLQNGEFSRIGSTEVKKVKVRVIAATNEDLDLAVQEGRFREDLLARIRGISIHIPPLCERRDDIRPIIDSVIASSDKPSASLTPDCLAFLETYDWPQNVRQLKATILSMLTTNSGNLLTIGDIPRDIISKLRGKEIKTQDLTPERSQIVAKIPSSLSLEQGLNLCESLIIREAFKHLPIPKTLTALSNALKVSRPTLIRRIKELGIELDRTSKSNF